MALRIRHKLIIAFSLFALFVTLVAFFAMLFTFRAGFLQYLNDLRYVSLQQFSQTVSEKISTEQDWARLTTSGKAWFDLIHDRRRNENDILLDSPLPKKFKEKGRSPDFHKRPPPKPKPHYVLLDENKKVIHGKASSLDGLLVEKVLINDQLRGYIGIKVLEKISGNADKVFVAKQTRNFIGIAIIACILAIVIAVFIANWMAGPIQRLVAATNRLMQRDYAVKVSYKGNDEIGSLVQSFNRLAKSLADHQQAQQQWIADISHELRTPLSTLKAELEAMQDGVREVSIERIHSLHDDVLRLQRLVDDLHELSLSDAGMLNYRFSPVSINHILNTVFDHHEVEIKKRQLTFSLDTLGNEYAMYAYADPDRLYQLFENLLQNSMRYTDKGGQIKVATKLSPESSENELTIEWEDSAPGVSDQSLEKLFDRLYREEQSRNREKGGSGLGLSICRAIVESHGGVITAKASSLGGLKITITLPKAKVQDSL